MSEERRIARQWIAKAASDLLSADNDLKASRTPFDVVCFHCQQAAEKMLKAFLAANGQAPPRTHDLLYLLELVLPLAPEAGSLVDDLTVLTPYAIEARYPDDVVVPSDEDAREARLCAERVRSWLETASPVLFRAEDTPEAGSRDRAPLDERDPD